MPLPSELQRAVDALLSGHGETDTSVRRRVMEYARSGRDPTLPVQTPELLSEDDMPRGDLGGNDLRGNNQREDALREFLDKVAERPWTVTDEDIIRLRAEGHSEDQIFELTLACALGAGLRRFDAGLRALEKAGVA